MNIDDTLRLDTHTDQISPKGSYSATRSNIDLLQNLHDKIVSVNRDNNTKRSESHSKLEPIDPAFKVKVKTKMVYPRYNSQ